MKAELISVGTELLAGSITDTNSQYLAQELTSLGITVLRATSVPDDLAAIADLLREALQRADLVVTTGGIGPTPDDLTRDAVAAVMGETLYVDAELEKDLEAYFERRGQSMPAANRRQACLIPSARPVRNRSGTAPGWWVSKNGKEIILMPGVPREMTTIWQEEVRPVLLERADRVIVSETIKTFGLGESHIAELLGDLLTQTSPAVATYAKRDGVHVVVRAEGTDREALQREVAATSSHIRALLGAHVWGTGDDTLARAAVRQLEHAALTLASYEEVTGGLLARALLETESSYYLGGVVANGSPPAADLLLHVGAGSYSELGDRRVWSCSIQLHRGGLPLSETTVNTASESHIRERPVYAALDLLRRYLTDD